MKKNLLTLVLCSFAFGLGFGINNIAVSENTPQKIGYINVGKLLAASKVLKTAETTRANQTKDMLKWHDTASADIQKQATPQSKEAAIKKYEAQLTQKKNSIKDAYAKKVSEVDNQLSSVINQKAKELGYDVVLRGDAVLYGGTDITAQVLPLVK